MAETNVPTPAGSTLNSNRAAAAHAAAHDTGTGTGTDTCSGAITPDTVHPCAEPTGTETYTVSLTDGLDVGHHVHRT
ncbi:hypothetical protein [Streptacidiphilus sp. PAMC 29251]